ncbi:hypothetical protein SASPL_154306 [Salvia splendens]|uniref:Uncharacterized protein n=1 Tax=Salvia splendens TaxID=180675 RepID=A0A8X8W0C8_SALSN|nr:hypothetical protein SASPL_154306 [Salvia splendens]
MMGDSQCGTGVRMKGIQAFEGNSSSPHRKFRKGDRTRRIWTVREEEILAASMLELLARGWKSVNGFRAGYSGKIEDSLLWSGMGFNSDKQYMIECDDDQWEAIVQVRSNLQGSSEVNENDYHPIFEDEEPNNVVPMSQHVVNEDNNSGTGVDKQTSTNKSGSSKKRKHEGPDATLMEFLANLNSETKSRLDVSLGSAMNLTLSLLCMWLLVMHSTPCK